MADIDADVIALIEHILTQLDEPLTLDKSTTKVDAAEKRKPGRRGGLRDRTNIQTPTATTTTTATKSLSSTTKTTAVSGASVEETSIKRSRKRKVDDISTTIQENQQPAEDTENIDPTKNDKASVPANKRQRTPRKQGAQLRAQHQPQLAEQMPTSSHTMMLPASAETGSLECECYSDLEYDQQVKQLSLLSEFTTNGSTSEALSATSTTTTMTINRLTTLAEFAYGQPYEVFTDECGLSVCYAVAPPIQHVLDEVEMNTTANITTINTLDESKTLLAETNRDGKTDDADDHEDKEDECKLDIDKENNPKEAKCSSSNNELKFNSPVPDKENQRKYTYNGSELTLLGGDTLVVYAYNVARSIFTIDELSNGLLPDERLKVRSTSNKRALDLERIEVIKEAIAAKFNTSKERIPWKEIRPKLNTKFSCLSRYFKQKEQLKKATSTSSTSA